MNFINNIRSGSIRIFFAALISMVAVSASAQVAGKEASQIIHFSSREELKATDAEKILRNRLELNANDELRSAYAEQPGEGLQVERFNQYYKGLKVEHGSMSMTSKNGVAAYAFGRFYPTSAIASATPALDAATAFSKAKTAVPAEEYGWEHGAESMPEARLSLIEDFKNGDGDGILHLAYAFEMHAVKPLARYMVYIDANDGHVLFMNSLIHHIGATGSGASLYSGTVPLKVENVGLNYFLKDTSRGASIITYSANNNPNYNSATLVSSNSSVFPMDPSVDAHWGARVVFDYWKTVHNRNSYDGRGTALKSYVHYTDPATGKGYNNAFWSGGNAGFMTYGDGTGIPAGGYPPLVALDVCGHEIGHGVCETTAGLAYNRESGALNEGLSDIWGCVIEMFGDPHEVDARAKDPWLAGEEMKTMRDFKNPKALNAPDTYLGRNWRNATYMCNPVEMNDWCGVHTNSSVLNHWFYLLSVGGSGQNDREDYFNVPGIGAIKAAKIVYAAELALNSTADFFSMRTATVAAAKTIYGACSPEAEATERAWFAVGVGGDFSPCSPRIGFGNVTHIVAEDAKADDCKASHIVTIPLSLVGGTFYGDSATVNVIVVGGNVVQGTDFDVVSPKFSFLPGGATVKNIDLRIYDNGASDTNQYVDITYSLNAGSTNASRSNYRDTTRVKIYSNDFIPYSGADTKRNILQQNAGSRDASPLNGFEKSAHAQYIYKASELYAAGVRPGVPVTSLAFDVDYKVSTTPYYNFNLSLAHTSMSDFSGGLYTGPLTNVYSDSLTTQNGWSEIPFKTPFIWNGSDNLVVELCYSNPTIGLGNDWVTTNKTIRLMAALAPGADCGKKLTINDLLNERPLLQLTQQATIVETKQNSTRSWNMPAVKDAYFYSAADEKIMAAILDPKDSLGCVTIKVTEAGNGFSPAANNSQRSLKEFNIQPNIALTATNFEAVLYFTMDELAGVDPNRLQILQTTSAVDSGINKNNTSLVTPVEIINGQDYIGFRGRFRQFGRFYLTDGSPIIALGISETKKEAIWTGVNPFNTAPVLHWNLSKSERVRIQLYDISGRAVYSSEATLASGAHQLTLNSSSSLVPGIYMLQVIRADGVFTRQMVKQQ